MSVLRRFSTAAKAKPPIVKTFANQGVIPRLPIPPLKDTVAKYLESCKPLLSPEEMQRTQAAVSEFAKPGGFGEVLQQRLHELDATAPNSWLEDIWLNKAYLEWREPSLINVNWWCQFKDHPNGLVTPTGSSKITDFQIERASGLISNLLNFKSLVESEQIPAEYMRDAPLCMNQYKHQFGVTRIPGKTADTLHIEFPPPATHVVVFCNDQIYKLEVLPNGQRLATAEIARALRSIATDSFASSAQPAVGVLTGGHRDTWSKGYEKLMNAGTVNKESFETIKTALFAVCLDHNHIDQSINVTHHQLFHNYNAHNRWFDKAIQLIVLPSGRAGINGEHTPSDAVIPGRIIDYIVSGEPAVDPANALQAPPPAPTKLKWVVNDEIKEIMAEAEKTATALINDTESVLLQTKVYGGNYIKETAKASPDAYVQLVLQLTWARLYDNKPTAVYESASTRLFKHGRTETGRSLTLDTWAFACGFDNSNLSVADKKKLFEKGIKSQSNYMKEATFGRGIDRHLLGLRCMIKGPEETPKATLFTDPAYIQSMYFKLSSSNMSPGDNFYGGFGPVVPEGYGVNYAIGKDNLKFSISCKKSEATTSSVKFRDTLDRTLNDMKTLF